MLAHHAAHDTIAVFIIVTTIQINRAIQNSHMGILSQKWSANNAHAGIDCHIFKPRLINVVNRKLPILFSIFILIR
ncbi:MAG: hypothetical protein PUC88_03665 [Clostridia bacterium]|nr:hypothetical protein [Clostridia bacterium]